MTNTCDWFEDRKQKRKKVYLQRVNGKNYHRKQGVMTKKELKAFFGHSFGQMRVDRQNISRNGIILMADRNRQLFDVYIEDENEWSEDEASEFLNQYRGWPIDLLV